MAPWQAGGIEPPPGAIREDVDRWLLTMAVDAAGIGVFDWDLTTEQLHWDERLLHLFGMSRDVFSGTIDDFHRALHPDDVERVSETLAQAIASTGSYESDYRVVLPGGEQRWIASRGLVLPGADGSAARLVGAALDVTESRDADTRTARILEALPTAFFSLDHDWRFTYANPVAQRLLGGVSTDVVGHVIWELFPAANGSEFEVSYRLAARTGQPVTFEAYYPPPLDDWYEVHAWPTPDGLSVYFLDITERRAAEQTSALLAEVTGALAETLDAEEGVLRLAQLVVPTLGDWCIVTLVDGETIARGEGWRRQLRDLGTWHADEAERATVERYAQTRIPALRDSAFLRRALTSSEPVLIESDAARAIAAVLEDGEARDICLRLDPESAVVVPLRGRGRTNGLLTIFRSASRTAFAPQDVQVLRDLGGRAGLALDNARAFAEQRDLAGELQRSMLTDPPEPDHLHVAVRYEPAAQTAQVGGDWYDSFLQGSGATNVVIGDVVGHDTAAAAAMGQVRGLLRGIAVTTDEGPAQVLQRVEDAMGMLQVATTASVVTARFEQTPEELEQGITRMRWSNAGHPPPLVAVAVDERDPSAVVDPVDVGEAQAPPVRVEVRQLWAEETNLLLGLDIDAERTESVVTLPRGATVVLYTDGLVERRGEDIEDGINRLAGVLSDLVAEGVDLERTCDELLRRMLPSRPEDDVALVAVRLHRQDRPRPAEAGPTDVPDRGPAASD